MGRKAALRMMGRADVADERVRAYFAQYDVDGNGTLDFEEFKGLARQLDADEHAGEQKSPDTPCTCTACSSDSQPVFGSP